MASYTTYELLDACRKPGCPICRLKQRYEERYLENLLYENVNNPQLRNWLRGSLGFCHEHAWLAVERRLGSALGFAIIYQDVIASTLERLEKDTPSGTAHRWASLLKRVPEQVGHLVQKALYAFAPKKRCPACHQRDEMTQVIVVTLIEELAGIEMAQALQASDGLCLPHLRMALQKVKSLTDCEMLLSVHREKLEILRDELAEFIRKNDYRFMKEGFGQEGDSWLRAVRMAAGNEKIKGEGVGVKGEFG